ncbi:zinc transporter ZntB [Flavisphingomonas formosensis]|uniref:zinc transporter ZntB n=1 Tax=Flavisphingomonas formosensis TaxID=861534 RepID=UPI0012FC56B3|nr:zinc transporter ZntB [Sphingomonas formosensis]
MKSWCYVMDAGGRAVAVPLREAECHPPVAPFTWIHLDGRDEANLVWLRERSNIPRHAVSALTAVETRPRSEQIGEGELVNMRGLGRTPEDDPDKLVSIRIWAERGRLISVSMRTLDAIEAVRDKMEAGKIHDPGDLVAAFAMAITVKLDEDIAALGDEIDECETTLHAEQAFKMRRTVARVRSTAIAYRRFVVPQRHALEQMADVDAGWLEEDDRLHLREAADRFARMAEELEAVRERSALMHEQLTDLRAEQLENRTLLLAIVAVVFLPLTFITGLLGMNVDGIPGAHSPWAFAIVVLFCMLMAAAITYYFMRARWFKG